MERSCRILQDLFEFLQDLVKTLQDLSMISEDRAMTLQNLVKNPSERLTKIPKILACAVAIIAMNCVFLAIELVEFWQHPTKPLRQNSRSQIG